MALDERPAKRSPLPTMKKRAAFLNAAKGVFLPRNAFVLQRNSQEQTEEPRVGYTVTKKVGNAVVRNRVRRRMREAVRLTNHSLLQPNHDYVLVGKKEALTIDFNTLCADVETALKKLAQGGGYPAREGPRRKRR